MKNDMEKNLDNNLFVLFLISFGQVIKLVTTSNSLKKQGLAVNEKFFNVLDSYQITGNYQKIFLFNVLNRQRNWVLLGLKSLYTFSVPFATPYNKENIEFCFKLNGPQLSARFFHRSFLRYQTKQFSNVLSPNFGVGLNNSRLKVFIKKVLNRISCKNKFLDNGYQYTYSNSHDQYIYKIENLINNTIYEYVSDLYKININSLKKLPYSKKSISVKHAI